MANTIRGVGCDMAEISRIERLCAKPRFLEKVYTPAEQTSIAAGPPERAAGIWAAKEAVSKALGTGFDGVGLRDIEIGHDALGAPCVTLHGRAARRLRSLGGSAVHLSISHERTQALAFAVIE